MPRSYLSMMVLTGLSIGAITGLSNTSVSNTILELILAFASGSAGIYILNSKMTKTETNLLGSVGVVGIFFLASFWAGYLPTTLHRYPGPQYYKWNSSLLLADNFALAEIYAHGQNLGMSDKDLERSIRAEKLQQPATTGSSNAMNCPLLSADPQAATQRIEKIYTAVQSNTGVGAVAKPAAQYISARFRELDRDLGKQDATAKAIALISFDRAIATLLTIGRDQSEIRTPSDVLCLASGKSTDTAGACVLAIDLQQQMKSCVSPMVDLLLTARAHARAYATIWKQPVSTAPAKSEWTLEGSETQPSAAQ